MNKVKEKMAKIEAMQSVISHIYYTMQRSQENIDRYEEQYQENEEKWYLEQIEDEHLKLKAFEEIALTLTK